MLRRSAQALHHRARLGIGLRSQERYFASDRTLVLSGTFREKGFRQLHRNQFRIAFCQSGDECTGKSFRAGQVEIAAGFFSPNIEAQIEIISGRGKPDSDFTIRQMKSVAQCLLRSYRII